MLLDYTESFPTLFRKRSMSKKKANTPYESKFADFIAMCNDPKIDLVLVHHAQALGDTYEEVIESLNRLANAEKKLQILPLKARKSPKR